MGKHGLPLEPVQESLGTQGSISINLFSVTHSVIFSMHNGFISSYTCRAVFSLGGLEWDRSADPQSVCKLLHDAIPEKSYMQASWVHIIDILFSSKYGMCYCKSSWYIAELLARKGADKMETLKMIIKTVLEARSLVEPTIHTCYLVLSTARKGASWTTGERRRQPEVQLSRRSGNLHGLIRIWKF